jgi:hypothetical protein
MHTALTKGAPTRTTQGDAVVEPACHQLRCSLSASALRLRQPDQLGDGACIAGQRTATYRNNCAAVTAIRGHGWLEIG